MFNGFISIIKKLNVRQHTLKNMNIGKKYGLALCFVFILFGISTVIVLTLMNKTEEDISNLESRGDKAIEITELGSIIQSKGISVVNFVQDGHQQFIDQYEKQQQQFDTLSKKLEKSLETNEQRELLQSVLTNDEKINDLFLIDILEEKVADNQTNTESLSTQIRNLRNESLFILEEIKKKINEERAVSVSKTKENQQSTFVVLLVSMIISIVGGSLLVFYISRVISRKLNKLVEVSNGIANGNLEVDTINDEGKDEIGRLAFAINTMSNRLRLIIKQISRVSHNVSGRSEVLTQSSFEVKAGSQQVSAIMQELSSGAETQVNNTNALSSSMESFISKLQEISASSQYINNSSNDVLAITEKGVQLMKESIHQMNLIDQVVNESVKKVLGLDTKSKEITKLISVIKNMAEQTNLLALNASIEAARAGEHGRGFAVVAEEVRKLAEQVSVSVSDITSIVDDIQQESTNVSKSLLGGYEEVKKGTKQMKNTGETFAEINQAMKQMAANFNTVTGNIATMSTNSQEMSVAVTEIATVSEAAAAGMEQTSASSQQTYYSMEEIANNAKELSKIAEELNELIRQFKY
ncbi:methyl-accepting chemotaxis protein [Gracilibacillus ureilyticus]|uniref:Methyl-accepting chemotaxis protein n=1 Tax=Gracilibacillus ureilyticus TaxID=531814 RepID=A0A1H9VQ45_9BACI|nr:methyl-accepting chemotaxis protein [Gracilibacillus ureilyticus]SES23920.1 methyl-accepting chemotaxis protein [Gracilibacillus ureilyticus]